MLLMLVAQMSTYPRVIATHCFSWGSTKFKLTHGALTAFEDLGVVAVALPRRARRCFSARLRRPPTRHRNCGRLPVCMPLGVPPALLGGHYRHRFDLGRCFEAWVPSTC